MIEKPQYMAAMMERDDFIRIFEALNSSLEDKTAGRSQGVFLRFGQKSISYLARWEVKNSVVYLLRSMCYI